FNGNTGLKASGRSSRESDRGCASQGGDLRQGCRRNAWRADQRFRGRRAGAIISWQGGRPDGRGRAGGARRRDAIGDGERILGDQGRAVTPVIASEAKQSILQRGDRWIA